MIPKKIHYCWFGGKPKPKMAEKCIASWKKYCPDFEIIEWNESNYDVHKNEYTSHCYDNKKWAYLSDFVRLDVVFSQGGIYFDTDVELVKPLDELLKFEAFYGFETNDTINTGEGFAAQKEHITTKEMLKAYLDGSLKENGEIVPRGCPKLNTDALICFGLRVDGSRQNVAGAEILPADFMNPFESTTGILNCTENTISIHRYSMGAQGRKERIIAHITRPMHRIFGNDCFSWLKKNQFRGLKK